MIQTLPGIPAPVYVGWTRGTKHRPPCHWWRRNSPEAESCVPNAMRTALGILGIKMTGAEAARCMRIGTGSMTSDKCSPQEWWRGYRETHWTDIEAVFEWPPEKMTLIEAAETLGYYGYGAAVISTWTPPHAMAMAIQDSSLHIVDNGGFAFRRRIWRGSNIYRMVLLRRGGGDVG